MDRSIIWGGAAVDWGRPGGGGIGLQTGAGQFTFSKGKSWILSPDFTIFRVVPSWALSEFAPYLKGH
jgi:hypothetical protein